MSVFDSLSWGTTAALVLVLIVWERHLRRASSVREVRWVIYTVLGIQVASYIIYYSLWWHQLANDPVQKHLLWPESDYMLRQLLIHISSLVAGWLSSLAVLLTLWYYFIKRGKGLMLDGADVARFVVATLVTGWPSFLFVFALSFVLGVLWMLAQVLAQKKTLQDRLVITPAILPAAIIALVFQSQLLGFSHLEKIAF